MRRALSITLLLAFFAPLLVPSLSALTSDTEASLPACCRSHGAHHCAMLHWLLRTQDAAPHFTSTPCANYPSTATLPSAASFTLAVAPQLSITLLHAATLPATTAGRTQLLLARTRRDRGPPSLLA